MPKNQQLISKKIERKSLHNKRKQGDAIEDEDSKFGRTIKALGNCRFKIMVPDYRHPDYNENPNRPLVEVEARIGGKSVCRIDINDIVIVADSGDIYEIVGKMDPHQATKLFKDNRIHSGLMNRTDSQEVGASSSGIEFVYEAEKPAASDEIDINAI
jgi:hypothetical protein